MTEPKDVFTNARRHDAHCCKEPESCFKAYTGDCTAHLPPSPLDEVPFMIVFDDTDRAAEMVIGYGPAKARYRNISMSWNAHLFVKLNSNSRDVKLPNATIVELSPPVGKPRLPFVIKDEELAALARFYECATDGEGYDVSQDMMNRLAQIGLLRRTSGRYYETTDFGLAVVNGDFDIPNKAVVSDPEPFDQWMHERLFANPPLPVTPFDAWQAGRRKGQLDLAPDPASNEPKK